MRKRYLLVVRSAGVGLCNFYLQRKKDPKVIFRNKGAAGEASYTHRHKSGTELNEQIHTLIV